MAREKDLRQALERLIRQLELGQFVNEKGVKITDNYAFVEAKKVLMSVVLNRRDISRPSRRPSLSLRASPPSGRDHSRFHP